ncbi:MAG: preprotein translocase subunit SecA [Actinomycetota bacterium]|nr:preprotein translocase subunit SecA [Actinomycetota bacterium]MDK1016223.1 preprotein translocase subunit SecA [Actinomycetota bacterium]MDK1025922.1 preprotein translocase subunit SecA [Actinomycetota bacterium]MDK1038575.1 preprotein translocase subunit SecA [Actinomycetota bacterium]MDK1096959.1 preprotein translocase subunit SecA [Actinomycetota bacterium]
MSIFNKALRLGEGKRFRELERLAAAVNAIEAEVEPLSDEELAARTPMLRQRIVDGETLDDIEVEAYATVREVAKRVLGQRHYDVQVIGAAALHRGMIAEMKTGEGKTLVGTMPAYLNSLGGEGVHIVTVNDYLASRDADWMGAIHRFLGLEVGIIQAWMTPEERRPEYAADITYGTNNEFGFDYLRDNMTMTPEHMVQRGHAFAIVDEVDSILIDEARTPLIISGRVGETGKWYTEFSRIASRLREGEHYEVDEKKRQVITTEDGVTWVEEILGIENMYDFANVDFIHHLDVALQAKTLYHHDVDYMIRNGEVMIVDEFTGRVLEGRRYSEGLHQAIESKEGVRIKEENQTLATITLQNYFRMYDKLSGMTGTAFTEESEFVEIYGLQVVVIPPNLPIARLDEGDVVYVDEEHKFAALADDIEERHRNGQPVLVGTTSIEKSERVADTLKRRGVPFEVLNAKQHEREAHIIAQAGTPGAITVATNMAGRGVDIMLGGNPIELAKASVRKRDLNPGDDGYDEAYAETLPTFMADTERDKKRVIEAGGLYVLGTERHESRRIDNQLRGRSGRQGDPGESRFYLSLEDDLMRRFANERVASIMSRLKIPPDVPIEAKMVTKSIERAQTQVESQNFEIRKNVLKYDEVMNTQRKIIYQWRNQILSGDGTEELITEWREEVIETLVREMTSGVDPSEWEWDELTAAMTELYPTKLSERSFDDPQDLMEDEVIDAYVDEAADAYGAREADLTSDVMRALERTVVLSVIDNKWREHLAEMDYLRSGIGLRAMGQRDPLVEYQREGFTFFEDLVHSTKADSIRYMFHVEVARRQEQSKTQNFVTSSAKGDGTTQRQVRREGEKIGRNDPCPCGGGKKYKRCHGAPGAEPLPA